MNFHEAAEHFETDKGPRKPTSRQVPGGICGHGYTFAYERELPAAGVRTRHAYRADGTLPEEIHAGRPFAMLEVGVQMGCSMRLWDWYLNPKNHPWGAGGNFAMFPFWGPDFETSPIVVGVEKCLVPGVRSMVDQLCNGGASISILEGDSTEPMATWKPGGTPRSGVVEIPSAYDVVIDDGSHLPAHQVATLRNLWPLVRPGGIYCIEDLHESWWPEEAQRGTLEPVLDQFWRDAVGRGKYAEWSGVPARGGPPGPAEETFFGVRFYRNLVVLEKRSS